MENWRISNLKRSKRQVRTGLAGHREIPSGPVAIKKYYINKLMFFAKTLGLVRLNLMGQFGKLVRPWSLIYLVSCSLKLKILLTIVMKVTIPRYHRKAFRCQWHRSWLVPIIPGSANSSLPCWSWNIRVHANQVRSTAGVRHQSSRVYLLHRGHRGGSIWFSGRTSSICRRCSAAGKDNSAEYLSLTVQEWCTARRLQLNPDKTELIWFGSWHLLQQLPPDKSSIQVCGIQVKPLDCVRNLGVLLDSQLTMRAHISKVVSTGFFHLRRLRQLWNILDRDLR